MVSHILAVLYHDGHDVIHELLWCEECEAKKGLFCCCGKREKKQEDISGRRKFQRWRQTTIHRNLRAGWRSKLLAEVLVNFFLDIILSTMVRSSGINFQEKQRVEERCEKSEFAMQTPNSRQNSHVIKNEARLHQWSQCLRAPHCYMVGFINSCLKLSDDGFCWP